MLVGMSTPRTGVLVRLAAAAIAAVSLGVASVPQAGASAPSAKRSAVAIKGFAFSPKTLQVKAGTKIKVTNKDGTTHTFTANKGAFDTGDIEGGTSATVTIAKPGTYAYHCTIHSFMHGTIKAT